MSSMTQEALRQISEQLEGVDVDGMDEKEFDQLVANMVVNIPPPDPGQLTGVLEVNSMDAEDESPCERKRRLGELKLGEPCDEEVPSEPVMHAHQASSSGMTHNEGGPLELPTMFFD